MYLAAHHFDVNPQDAVKARVNMEVAGVAVGAAALGIQLVSTARKVRTFITSMEDAPEGLTNLESSLHQLEAILEQVTEIINTRSRHVDTSGPVDLLEQAVYKSEPNVMKLGHLVDKLQRRLGHGSRRRVLWASLSSIVNQDDLVRYRSLLHEDLTALNTALALMT